MSILSENSIKIQRCSIIVICSSRHSTPSRKLNSISVHFNYINVS
uniref:Serine/threonine-protein kinase n=1 Tax=Rhizophora mucronata TaxID=61149 RepID=A0A2P2MHU0_RHIMU